jgi:hypothetical protein
MKIKVTLFAKQDKRNFIIDQIPMLVDGWQLKCTQLNHFLRTLRAKDSSIWRVFYALRKASDSKGFSLAPYFLSS